MILIPLSIEKCIFACMTSCTPTKSERTCPIHTSNIPSTKSHIHFLSPRSFIQGILPGPRCLVIFRNKVIFYGEEFLAPRPIPKLEDHPLSAVRNCLCNIFAASLHIWRPSPPSATWGRAMPWWQGTPVFQPSMPTLVTSSVHFFKFLWRNTVSLDNAFPLYTRI
jgi:hypothetical protein